MNGEPVVSTFDQKIDRKKLDVSAKISGGCIELFSIQSLSVLLTAARATTACR